MKRQALRCLCMALFVVTALPSRAETSLQPYQMVRSLQLLQDRLAAGDHAALPMQKKLLTLIDSRLQAATSMDFKNPHNVRATLIYAMSGGNPATVENVLTPVPLSPEQAAVVEGVLHYLHGRRSRALASLEKVEPLSLQSDVGAFVALIKASVIGSENMEEALALLDQARLLGTGTLVDEAALRRSIQLVAALGDQDRFLHLSGHYIRRFLQSPYASQFAQAFTDGVIELQASIDPNKLDDIIAGMTPDEQQHIYLELARRAAIRGMGKFSAFAAAKAKIGSEGESRELDPRAALYSSLASVASDNIDETLKRLNSIDRSGLSQGDRRLLEAAITIAEETLRPPVIAADVPLAHDNKPEAEPAVVPEEPDRGVTAAVSGGEPATATLVSDVRDKLKAVDQLLEGAAE